MKKITIYMLAACFTITTSWACFMTLSLEQMVQRSEIIVKGTIVRIEYPANKDATRKTTRIKTGENTYSVATTSTGVILDDTAYILIEQILKAPTEIKTGDRIPFAMPSIHNLSLIHHCRTKAKKGI